MEATTKLEFIKGVGPKTAEKLAVAGLYTVSDVVAFFPRAYDDYSATMRIAELRPGKVTLRGSFEAIRSRRVRRGLSIIEATLVDDSGKVAVVWFNQPYRSDQIKKTGTWLVSGDFGLNGSKYQLTNPNVEVYSDDSDDSDDSVHSGGIVPIYRERQGIKSLVIRKIIHELRPYIMSLPETLPSDLVTQYKLMPHADAVLELHLPTSQDSLARARHRIGFEEVFALMFAARENKQANAALEGLAIGFNPEDAKRFIKELPFELTNAQRVAAWEMIQNFGSGEPMNRLLQGDVGAGKTVVAALVGYIAAQAGFQTAFMAPTELLASQHAETLHTVLSPFGVTVGFLSGSVTAKSRRNLLPMIKDGAVAVVVGTHALIQDTVAFHNLGFVVIDEQHRFGVEQRQKLLAKADKMPHLLAMTATPIPRSLQLTVYGELDISILGEKPKNRLPIITKIVSPNSREQMYESVEAQILAGHQVYVICPRIDEGKDEMASVKAEVARLKRSRFKKYIIGELHGKLSSEQKDTVMKSFASGETNILVSTTVVEVGVDVPNATAMIIEGADRFGLAQLHQLRGRVGRSAIQSYCYLVPATSAKPSQRLRELERSNDGFYLAERDLEIRGPGEIYGRAQHGELNLAIANLADTQLLKEVRAAVDFAIKNKLDLLHYKQLQSEVARYRRLTTLN